MRALLLPGKLFAFFWWAGRRRERHEGGTIASLFRQPAIHFPGLHSKADGGLPAGRRTGETEAFSRSARRHRTQPGGAEALHRDDREGPEGRQYSPGRAKAGGGKRPDWRF